MVVPIGRDNNGTDFVCLSCRKEFRLPKMTFYDEKTNSLMTGWCFMGSHTTSLGLIFHSNLIYISKLVPELEND